MPYIDIDQLFKCETCFYYRGGKCTSYCDWRESYRPAISKLKIADVEEVRHGYIIEHEGHEDEYDCECSVCHTKEVCLGDKYCSECGAKLDGGAI
jgi:hypothetical protein